WDGPGQGPRGGPPFGDHRGEMFGGRDRPMPDYRGRDGMNMGHMGPRPLDLLPMEMRRMDGPPMRGRDMDPHEMRGREPNRDFFRSGDEPDFSLRRHYENSIRDKLMNSSGFPGPGRNPADMGGRGMPPREPNRFMDMREREPFHYDIPRFNSPNIDGRRGFPVDLMERNDGFRDRPPVGTGDTDHYDMDLPPRERRMMDTDRRGGPPFNPRGGFDSDMDFRNRPGPSTDFRGRDRSPLRFGNNDVPALDRGRPDMPPDVGPQRSDFMGAVDSVKKREYLEQSNSPLMDYRSGEEMTLAEEWKNRRKDKNSDQDYRSASMEDSVSNTVSVTGIPKTATMEQILGAFAVRDGVPMQGMKIKNVVPYSYDTAYVEFLNLEDAVHFMESNKGSVKVGTRTASMKYIQPEEYERGVHSHSQWQRSSDLTPEAWQQQVDQRLEQHDTDQQAESWSNHIPPHNTSHQSDSVFKDSKMIIKNVKPTTTVETILKALDPFAYLDERNVRLVKGKPPGSKCFCFVDMDSHEQVTRLVELLTKPRPLYIDGVRVYAEVAKPLKNQKDVEKPNTSILGFPPEAGIIGTEIPDISNYLYDATSGFYYDPETTLYYDPNSRYFYNAQTQEYLYWDAVSKTYIPVPGSNSADTQPVTMTAEDQAILSNPAADAPLEMKKPSVPPQASTAPVPAPVSASSSTPESVSASTAASDKKEEDDSAKKDKEKDKEEKPRSLAAVKIMKDMERWAKIQNRQKETVRAPSPVLKTGMDDDKRQSKSADAAFAVFERKGGDDLFKKPLAPAKKDDKSKQRPMGSLGMLASDYGAGSDEEVEEEKEEETVKTTQSSQSKDKDDKLTDWKKMACLLCRRQFPNKDALIRHQQLSDLHKQNMEIHLKIKRSKKELEALENQEREPQLSAREAPKSPEQKRRKHHHSQPQHHNTWAGSSEMNKVSERPGLGAEPVVPRKKKEPVVWDHATYKQAVRKAMFARFKELE
uniref:RNA binding motif protein 6 n=1 Tax=Amphilophus citrinellus TaxID=61819 RepID=A0A3Q0RF42_AMPCI